MNRTISLCSQGILKGTVCMHLHGGGSVATKRSKAEWTFPGTIIFDNIYAWLLDLQQKKRICTGHAWHSSDSRSSCVCPDSMAV
jgi:hypothetical protein